jgi:hypothetical protein
LKGSPGRRTQPGLGKRIAALFPSLCLRTFILSLMRCFCDMDICLTANRIFEDSYRELLNFKSPRQ